MVLMDNVKEVNKNMSDNTENELVAVQNDPILAQMYKESVNVGSENLTGGLPLLKVHAVGKSNNELANGAEPEDGTFYYTQTKEQFKEVEVHVLTISRGFKAMGMPDKNGKTEPKFNQLLGGVIVDTSGYKPFIMYFTGKKLSLLWDFGKDAKKFTSAGIPMFVLLVKMTTEKVTNSFGKSWLVNFEIVKSKEGTPTLVHDVEEFNFLKQSVATIENSIKSIIDAKDVSVEETEPLETYQEEPIDIEEVDSLLNSTSEHEEKLDNK